MYIYHKIFLETHPELGLIKIPEGWCIHHINGNHYDNTPDNLQLMTRSDHAVLHHIGDRNPMFGRIGEKNHMYGRRHTEESRKKISDAQKGKVGHNTGKKCSDESRQMMSDAHKGQVSGNKGNKHSDETKKKISDAHKGNTYRLGKKCSEESKRIMSESHKGKQVKTTQEMIDDVVMNGISKRKFCKKHGVSEHIWREIRRTMLRCNGNITVQDYLETGYKT